MGSDTYPKAIDLKNNNRLHTGSAPVAFSNVPMFQVTSTGQGHVGATTGVGIGHVLKFNTKYIDTHNGYNTSTFRYTIPVTGNWYLSWFHIAGLSTYSAGAWYLYKNGSIFVTGGRQSGTTADNRIGYTQDLYWTMQHTANIFSFTAGDYIDIRTGQDAAEAYASYYGEDINGWMGYYVGAQ